MIGSTPSHSAAFRTFSELYWLSATTTLNPTPRQSPLEKRLKVELIIIITRGDGVCDGQLRYLEEVLEDLGLEHGEWVEGTSAGSLVVVVLYEKCAHPV
jgi:hypothetical protein